MTAWRMTPQERQALAQFVVLLRRPMPGQPWHRAGVADVLDQAADMAPAPELAQAMIRVAANPVNRTPAILLHEGPHWRGAEAVHVPPPSPVDRCKVCSRSRQVCTSTPFPRDPHVFQPDLPAEPEPAEVVERRRAELAELHATLKARRRRG